MDLQEIAKHKIHVAWAMAISGAVLLTFHKIHYSTVYIDKEKYLTPAPSLRKTRASQTHDSQYCRYLAYGDALKNLFCPQNCSILE